MALAGLLALIVGASVSAASPTGLVAIAAEGVLGNQADATFLLGCQHLIKMLKGQETAPVQDDLKRSLYLSYLRALVSISSACKVELVGNFPQTYRGQPVYDDAIKADIRWLDIHLEQLKQKIALAESKNTQPPDISLDALEGFSRSGSSISAIELASQEVMEFVIAHDAIPLYIEKLKQPQIGLIDTTFSFFVKQLDQNSDLRTFFETQLLVQIHSSLAEQTNTLQEIDSNLKKVSEISQDVPQQFEQVIDKLASIETDERPDIMLGLIQDVRSLLLSSQRGSVEQTNTVSLAVSDANPFVPIGGRIDSADQFFGQEQTLGLIFETLNSGSSVALIGEPEMGKSSLLKAVEARAKAELTIPREPIYLDLRDVADEADFYYALCDKVGVPECKGFRLARQLQSKRLLLILDEIEKMTWDGFTNQVRGQLRSLSEGRSAPLRLVIAASKSLDRLFIDGADGNRVSPLSGICREARVTPWTDSVIRAFISDRLQPTSVVFPEADILSIIQASEGKPREIVKLCYERYASSQRPRP